MRVYYFTILFVFISAYLAISANTTDTNNMAKKPFNIKLCLSINALILIMVAGLRYYVGTDFGSYYRVFELHAPHWREAIEQFSEPGFPVLAMVMTWFTSDGAMFIFFTAAFTIGSILFVTYKYTNTYLFSALLFVFVGIWHGAFNGVRQYFAAAIICLGHRYILDKKVWKYLLCVFIAFLFHSSAIVMIIPYFTLRNKVSLKNITILGIGTAILLSNYEFLFSFVGSLKDETIDTKLTYMSSQVSMLRIAVCVLPAIFCLLLYLNIKKDREQTFYLNIIIFYALLSIIGMNSPYLSRVNIYLQVLLPLAMGRLIVFRDKKSEFMMKSVIIVLFFVFWYVEVSQSDSLSIYRFIWQR